MPNQCRGQTHVGAEFSSCARDEVAFDRGRVGIVAPLNATQSLWAVAFAAVLVGRDEAIGRHTVLAGALVVAGGVLIGLLR